MESSPLPLSNPMTRCPVIYDADGLLVINKPSGVLSHPNPPRPNPSGQPPKKQKVSFEGNYDFHNRKFSTPGGPVWLIHRLDQDTSGVLIACRDEQTAKTCRLAFEHLQVTKIYQTLVYGRIHPASGFWKDCIQEERQPRGRGFRGRVMMRGKPNAQLQYKVLRNYSGYPMTLLEIKLITGRTHQIRIQTAYRKHPIAGDDLYGDFSWNRRLRQELGLRRIFLHAASVEIKHPKTGEKIELQAPLPPELVNCLEKIS